MKNMNIALFLGLVSLYASASDMAGCVVCDAYNDPRHASSHKHGIVQGREVLVAYHRSDELGNFVIPAEFNTGSDNEAHKERIIRWRLRNWKTKAKL